ncbi:MAG TPA: hypothetical protein VIL99_06790 [Ignavibacteria bacterium]
MYKKEVFFVLIFTILFLFASTAQSKSENVYLSHDQIIVLKADVVNFLITLSGTKDDVRFNKILEEINSEADTSLQAIILSLKTKLNKQGLSLSDYFGHFGFNNENIEDKLIEMTGNAIESSITTLIKRLEYLGIINPVVYQTGSTRISVELPSELSEEMKAIIQTTGMLSFNLCKDFSVSKKLLQDVDKVIYESEQVSKKDLFSAYFNEEFSKSFEVLTADENDLDKIEKILQSEEVKAVIPNDIAIYKSNEVIKTTDDRRFRKLYLVKKDAELTGKLISDATCEIDKNTEIPYVSLVMNKEGSKEWERITGENIKKKCAIIFDGIVFSTPVIMSKIIGGKSWIQGMATTKEAKILSILLKSGALEIPLKILD